MITYVLRFLTACAIATPIYLILRRPRRRGREEAAREWCLGFFVVFMTGLLYMTFRGTYAQPGQMLASALDRIRTGRDIALVPFRNLKRMYLYDDREHFIMNILGNTLMFVPWGFFRPLLWKKQQHFGRMLSGAVLLTVFIEFVQLFICRTVDIDDIILNTLGSLAGSLLYVVAAWLIPRLKKTDIMYRLSNCQKLLQTSCERIQRRKVHMLLIK